MGSLISFLLHFIHNQHNIGHRGGWIHQNTHLTFFGQIGPHENKLQKVSRITRNNRSRGFWGGRFSREKSSTISPIQGTFFGLQFLLRVVKQAAEEAVGVVCRILSTSIYCHIKNRRNPRGHRERPPPVQLFPSHLLLSTTSLQVLQHYLAWRIGTIYTHTSLCGSLHRIP